MRSRPSIIALLASILAACASAQTPEPREAYIRAHAHGWVELTLDDRTVPSHTVVAVDGHTVEVKPQCSISVLLNSEPFLRQAVFPAGASPPYRVSTGFRFAVPAGTYVFRLRYAGCRSPGDEDADLEVEGEVAIADRRVTSVRFDGSVLEIGAPVEDTAVTLESLDASIEGVRSQVEGR